MSKITESMWAGLINGIGSREDDIEKPKRGRPRKGGEKFMQDCFQLYRTFLMIEGFQKFRTSGFNRTLSIHKAILQINASHPQIKKGISVSDFKKVLAKYHPTKGDECWLVEKILDDEVAGFDDWPTALPGTPAWDAWSKMTLGLKLEYQTKEVMAFGIGKPPEYPKIPKRMNSINFSKTPKKAR